MTLPATEKLFYNKYDTASNRQKTFIINMTLSATDKNIL